MLVERLHQRGIIQEQEEEEVSLNVRARYVLKILELSSAKFSLSIIGINISRYIDIGIEKIL